MEEKEEEEKGRKKGGGEGKKEEEKGRIRRRKKKGGEMEKETGRKKTNTYSEFKLILQKGNPHPKIRSRFPPLWLPPDSSEPAEPSSSTHQPGSQPRDSLCSPPTQKIPERLPTPQSSPPPPEIPQERGAVIPHPTPPKKLSKNKSLPSALIETSCNKL